jgi:hypothetical protein
MLRRTVPSGFNTKVIIENCGVPFVEDFIDFMLLPDSKGALYSHVVIVMQRLTSPNKPKAV